jgi:hypothetical protein
MYKLHYALSLIIAGSLIYVGGFINTTMHGEQRVKLIVVDSFRGSNYKIVKNCWQLVTYKGVCIL